MSADDESPFEPHKHCVNAACSLHKITVRTNATECVGCSEKLLNASSLWERMFGAGSSPFGPFGGGL